MEAPLRWIQPGEEDLTGKVWERGSPWMEPDEEWIRDQYEVQRKSVKEIAEQTTATSYCVKKWLKRHGVEIRQRTSKGEKRSKIYRTRSDKGKKRGPREPNSRTRSDKGKTRSPYRRRPHPRAPESLRERAKKLRTKTEIKIEN